MNRFWMASRGLYSRGCLLPTGRNSKKPDKIIGMDGKLLDDDSSSVSTADIVKDITDSKPACDNPETALQRIFFLLTVLPYRPDLLTHRILPSQAMAPPFPHMPRPMGNTFPLAKKPAPSAIPGSAIILTRTLPGDGTVTINPGISDIHFICSAAGTASLRWNSRF